MVDLTFYVHDISVNRTQKDNLKQLEAQEEQRLIRGQKEYLDLEIRKFRRKKLLIFHSLEQELLREVRTSAGLVGLNHSDLYQHLYMSHVHHFPDILYTNK